MSLLNAATHVAAAASHRLVFPRAGTNAGQVMRQTGSSQPLDRLEPDITAKAGRAD
jgi:hypothetical protein